MRGLSGRLLSLCVVCLLLLAFTVKASAQNNAALEGTISDTSGAAISGATVLVENEETGVASNAVSNDTGFYRVSQLVPGNYAVTVNAPSFQQKISNHVQVQAERVAGFNVTLAAGQVSQTVTVSAEGGGVETENASNQNTISTVQVLEIPQPGRDPYELVRLTPGVLGNGARNGAGGAAFLGGQVVGPGASNSQIFQTENAIQAVSNGQRLSANNILLDGVSVNSLNWGGAAVVTPNQESVNEITVVASGYDAENGRNSGTIVKTVSKNGGNSFHGSGLIKFDDPGLNAFNKFYGPTPATPVTTTCEVGTSHQFVTHHTQCPERVSQKYRQFGGSLGGPIVKDHLFFFFSYEGVRLNNSSLQRSVTLESPFFEKYVVQNNPGSIAAKIFSTPGIQPRIVNTIKEVNCCSLDGRPVGTWYQPGTAPGQAIGNGPIPIAGASDWGVYDLRIPNSSVGNQFNGRLDYNQGKNQIFFGTYYTLLDNLAGGRRPIEDIRLQPSNYTFTVGFTRVINNSLINDLRGNITRFSYNQLNPSGNTNFGIPQIRIFDFDASGFGDPGRVLGVPQASTTPSSPDQKTFAFRDTATWITGQHAIKFGGEIIKEHNDNNEPGASRPDYQFRGLLNFANDACCFFEGIAVNPLTGGPADALRHFRTSDYALFGQDTWKVRPNLTVTLGLRWEYFTPLTETSNKITNYVFGSQGFINGSVKPASRLYSPDRTNFGPKLGFAYSPDALKGNFVLRGGFGISYNRNMGTAFSNIRQNTPFTAQVGACCFFDPGPINGPPPGSNILYALGANKGALSYPANPGFANGIAPDGALCANKACTSIVKVDLFGALPHEPNPVVYSYSLEAQQAVTQRDVVRVGYYGSQSRKLLRTIDLNRLIPGDTFDGDGRNGFQSASADGVPCGPANPACPAPIQVGNPRFDRIFLPLPDVNASFDEMIANFTHRTGYGLNVSATYTLSHTIDTGSYDIGAQQFEPSNQLLERANSNFDIRNYLQLAAVWDLPIYRGRHDLLGNLLGGWTVSTIATHQSGFPFTADIGSCDPNHDRNGDGFCPDFPFAYFGGVIKNPSKQQFINGIFPNPATSFDIKTKGPGCQCRNIFRGPGYTDFDFTLAKSFGLPTLPFLGEGGKLDFRANAFNAFNILNLSTFAPGSASTDIVNTGSFGKANSALAGRVIEFQVRVSF